MSDQDKIQRVPVCPKCGSDNVVTDAAARWSKANQEWEVSNIFDKGHGCDDCGAEDIEFAWVEKNSQETRSLDDIDVREEETEEGVVNGGRVEVATFAEGEYVESILIDRARAMEVYRDLGSILKHGRAEKGNTIALAVSDRETGTILAALRYWQREGLMSAGHEQDIATDGGRLEPLSVDEIDALSERVNFGNDDRDTPTELS